MSSEPVGTQGGRRILMIASDPAISPVTQWPIGFWWAELTHPFHEFASAGYEIDIVSPDGGDLEGDGFSDPEHESGYSANDLISLGFKHSPSHAERLKDVKSIADVSLADYDAIMIAGGQGPMITMIDDQKLHRFIAEAYENGKIVCVICHATCTLLKVRLSNGSLLVDGKTWTGFANSEEDAADSAVGMTIQPFRIEDEARKLDNTNFIVSKPFSSFAVRDGNLITGQQQASGAAAAREVIAALGRS